MPLVGGDKYAYELLEPLEALACIEETVVRDKAVEVIVRIAKNIPKEQLEPHYLPLVRRLTQGDWFTNRVSACGLYTVAYKNVSPVLQEELRNSFKHLVEDDTPMVRRAAASSLKGFCQAVCSVDYASDAEKEQLIVTELLPIIDALAIRDEQDSVRCLTVPAIVTSVKNCKSIKGRLAEILEKVPLPHLRTFSKIFRQNPFPESSSPNYSTSSTTSSTTNPGACAKKSPNNSTASKTVS